MSDVLSATDFLGLSTKRRVIPVDLAEVGHDGVVYIREMSEGEKEKTTATKGKVKTFKDGSSEFDLSSMPRGASAKLLKASLVTDAAGQTLMADEMEQELKYGSLVIEKLEAIPAAVVNLLVREIRQLNAIGESGDAVEKKDTS